MLFLFKRITRILGHGAGLQLILLCEHFACVDLLDGLLACLDRLGPGPFVDQFWSLLHATLHFEAESRA